MEDDKIARYLKYESSEEKFIMVFIIVFYRNICLKKQFI